MNILKFLNLSIFHSFLYVVHFSQTYSNLVELLLITLYFTAMPYALQDPPSCGHGFQCTELSSRHSRMAWAGRESEAIADESRKAGLFTLSR